MQSLGNALCWSEGAVQLSMACGKAAVSGGGATGGLGQFNTPSVVTTEGNGVGAGIGEFHECRAVGDAGQVIMQGAMFELGALTSS